MKYYCGLSDESPASCVYADEDPDNNYYILCADVGIAVEACPYQIKEIPVQLSYWKKGMKVKCPECDSMVAQPYNCSKCGAVLKPFVKMSS
jgi:DNA-directed RNA polymerase subunit RPC12/RpoP